MNRSLGLVTRSVLLVLGIAALLANALSLVSSLLLQPEEATPWSLAALPRALLIATAMAAAVPSLKIVWGSSQATAGVVPKASRQRIRRTAEMGAVAWALMAVIWALGERPATTWFGAPMAVAAVVVICVVLSVTLFRTWNTLRG